MGHGTAEADRVSTALALAVADAGWYTTENLFAAIDRSSVQTLLLQCLDYRNAWMKGWRPGKDLCRLVHERERLWSRRHALPPGWMKRYPRLGMRPIARSIQHWYARVSSSAELVLIMTYPHYLHLRDQLTSPRSVYFNVDDYRLYWPSRADEIEQLEHRVVRESDLTVCVSNLRCSALRAALPEAADRIKYLPHGAPEWTIPDQPHQTPALPPADLAAIPAPRVGYVGTLEDRVDWELLDELARARPGVSIVLVGSIGRGEGEAWTEARTRCLSRHNVHAVGWRPQTRVGDYVAAFDACLIPYRVDHPFNQACNPTKIMDYMGSGRPIVSTALPECLSHRERIHVVDGPEAFLAALDGILANGSNDGRAWERNAYARAHSCARMADRLLSWIGAAPC